MLAGLLEGTRLLSIRQATLGVAATLTGWDVGVEPLTPTASVVILTAVVAIGFAIATLRLRRFQVRAAD